MSDTPKPWERERYSDGGLVPVHEDVWRMGHSLYRTQGEDRRCMADDAIALYFGNSNHGFIRGQGISAQLGVLTDPAGYNVIQTCVDTKTAHIVRNKVLPLFVTERGDSELKEKAKGMQRAVEATFGEAGIYGPTGVNVCFDGQLFDAGGVAWSPDYANNRVLGERVFAHECLVSPQEARLGKPRQMWRVRPVDRAVMLDMFQDDADAVEAIKAAPPAPENMLDHQHSEADMVADMIVVVEYWHLPSGRVDRTKREALGMNEDGDVDSSVDPGHDGRRVMCLEHHTLLDEPWPYDYFPVAFFKPMPEPVGFWSRSIPETLAPAQLSLNKWNARLEGIMDLHAVPRLLVWASAKLNTQQLTNDWATIITTAVRPQEAVMPLSPPSVPAEIFRRIEDIIRWAERQAGLSEMSIAAARPPGIQHAPALQHLSDTESVRHTPAFRAWEQFHLDSARAVVDCLRLLAARNEDFEVIWGNSKQLKRIKWKDVDIEPDRYHLKVWPTNLLPQTPAAKQQRVAELVQSGMIDRTQALALLDFPDIEGILGDTTAELDNIDRKLEAAKRGDTLAAMPTPYLDLMVAQGKARQVINRMEADGEDEDTIDRVRQWLEDCMALAAKAAAAAQPPPDAPSPPEAPLPEGAPMPQPEAV